MDKIPPSEGGDAGSIPAERIEAKRKADTAGIEPEGGRGNYSFPVEEGFGKPRVSEE